MMECFAVAESSLCVLCVCLHAEGAGFSQMLLSNPELDVLFADGNKFTLAESKAVDSSVRCAWISFLRSLTVLLCLLVAGGTASAVQNAANQAGLLQRVS
jgi:hypothetical protein